MTTINAANAGTYAFDDQFKVNRMGYGVMQLTGPGHGDHTLILKMGSR